MIGAIAVTIRHIRIFLEVCRTMNVTRAAENLYMTQPAVSRSIHEIEQVYGVRLFERLNQRLYLTDSGRRMRAYAVHIIDTFDQMERELSDGDERGMLRIGASITLGNYELPGVVRRMKQERPSLRLQATVANVDTLKEMLLDNRLDLAMIEAPIEHRDLTVFPRRAGAHSPAESHAFAERPPHPRGCGGLRSASAGKGQLRPRLSGYGL